jgi:RNA polymerase sigma factor (sigma-70 family)
MDELASLVLAAQQGDDAAFARIRFLFADMALSLANRWLGDRHRYLAEDVVQEAFTEVYLNLADLRMPAAFPGWFRRIVYKHSDRYNRADRAQVALNEASDPPGDPPPIDSRQGFVFSALGRLPRPQQIALTFYTTGYSYDEIAALLEVPVTTVKKQLYEARQYLRREREATLAECLEEESEGDDPLQADIMECLENEIAQLGGETGRRPVTAVPVGKHPGGVAVNPVTNRIYVVNSAVGSPTGSVSVIDGDTQLVIATIPMGRQPRCIAVNPETNRLYVTHYFPRTVWVLDGSTHHTLAIFSVAGNPLGVDVNPLTNRIYVASVADGDQGGTFAGVSVIDATTHQPCAMVPVGHQVPSASGPVCLRVNPLTNRIYVGGTNPGAVSIIDGDCNCAVATLDMPDPIDIGLNSCANRIYVANYAAGTLAVVDGADHSIVVTVGGYRNPVAVDVDAGADRVYVVHGNLVSILSAVTNTTIALAPLPGDCFILTGTHGGFRVNPNTHRLYVSQQQAGVVFVVEDRPA